MEANFGQSVISPLNANVKELLDTKNSKLLDCKRMINKLSSMKIFLALF